MTSDILFLEDDRAQMVIYKSLVARHFPHLTASFTDKVSEAEEILKTNPIKVAVLDLMIPVTNGADLIIKMKSNSIYSEIKIIVVSAAEKGSLLYDALEGVVEEFVTKPIDTGKFADLIAGYLD